MKRIFTAGLTIMIGLSMLSAPAPAQQRKPRPPQSKKESASKPALAVVNNPTPSYLSGEVNVTVRGDENPIIRLQMVPNGQALVEFPAKDRIFKVNPADPDLVTIEDSPTKEFDRYILLRSSKQFLPGLPNSQPPPAATSMIVQMTSGMVITLLIHPAREFEQVVHRCVVRYDRDAIVKARQAAGLAVNLDQRDENTAVKAPASLQVVPLPKTTPESGAPSTSLSQPTQNAVSLASATPTSTKEEERDEAAIVNASPSTPKLIVRATETKASKEGKDGPAQWEEKVKWSKPFHGLKVAAHTRVVNANRRQTLVSVHNTLSTPVNIAPAQPELSIQTLDESERVLQVEPVKPLKIEVSHFHGLIAPGATAFYLITYEPPVLGAKQRLCVAVAQSAAADEPVVVELTKGIR
jgi:hypothetical protein